MGGKSSKLKSRLKGSRLNRKDKNTAPVLTSNQKKILTESWSNIQDEMTQVGVITFIGLFEANPRVKHTFVSFRSVPSKDLTNSSLLRAHALRVMTMVDKCVSRLDELEKIEETMKSLGTRHSNYQVMPEHVDLMGPHFVQALQKCMESEWSKETEEAWLQMFKLMTFYMKEGLK